MAPYIDDPGGPDQSLLLRSGSTWTALAPGSSGQQLMVRSDGTVRYVDPPTANVRAWLATGDGTTDDTAAFNAARDAAGPGGTIEVPKGTYRLDTFAPLDKQTLRGAGPATVLKAKAGASCVVFVHSTNVNTDRRDQVTLRTLRIDGNAKASHGVRALSAGSIQQLAFDFVAFQNCDDCVRLEAGNQTDKVTYVRPSFGDSNTGIRILEDNSQEQVLINPDFGSLGTGVAMAGGTLTQKGGQYEGCTVGIEFIGTWCLSVSLEDVIFESAAAATDIRSTSGYWPSQGVHLKVCTLQGTTATVDMGTAGVALLSAERSTFNNGNIKSSGGDVTFWDWFNTYGGGASWAPTGTTPRHFGWGLNGPVLDCYQAVVNSTHNFANPLTMNGTAGQTAALLRFMRGGALKSQITSQGSLAFNDINQGPIVKDASNGHWYRIGTNLGVITATDMGTSLPN